ncbi:MAG: ferrous iron transport protein B [Alistipes sp.]|nr:ferrous iron transport protein B [Alistipes sp.]
MRLSELKTGESATILKVIGHGGFRRRIVEMGFIRGKRVEVVLNAPLKDPIEYRIMDYEVSLRRSEAQMVEVLTDEEARQLLQEQENAPVYAEEMLMQTIDEVVTRRSRTITVALVGNPNSGKTSLFNALSGGHEHVGNYSGVTVGAKSGTRYYRGYRFEITDLPGTYALSAYTPEEQYVRAHLAEQTPDVIINAVVASNLERNLYLTTELIDINPRMVVALNMYDELNASGSTLDYDALGRMLGVPMVPVEARNRKGMEELLDTVIAVYENSDDRVRHIHIHQGSVIEESLQLLCAQMAPFRDELPKAFPPRYFALKLLEGDRQVEQMLASCAGYARWCEVRDREVKHIVSALEEDVETALTNQKYGFISGALKETFSAGQREEQSATKLIDTFVTHKLFGFPIFFLMMGLMFWCTFSLGAYPQEWIDALVGWIGSLVDRWMPDGVLRDLLSEGVIGGVGSVIVFLPNIMILYLFISFMEDSGYLARAAFIMDRVMHRVGLHGKSFIPLIMGFGCNVPAIMACRTIESRSSRLITILITPFMSCSARLPVYILLTAAFFPLYGGWVLTGLYLLGVAMAILTARLMRRFFYPVDETPFVMELPPYRLPTWRTTLSHMWDKCAQYLKKMGGMILVASIIIWFLSYYPRTNEQTLPTENHYENSYLGRLGKACEPVFEPLGLEWKTGVSLLSGVAAKEIVVSTIGVLYAVDDADSEEGSMSLARKLAASGDFTTASALALLVFVLLYFPCIATIAAIKSELGWGWSIGALIYNTALAWVVAWIVYAFAGLFI